MVLRPVRVIFLACLLSAFAAQSQDLRTDKAFFQKKKNEYNIWLRQNRLGHIFRADSVAVSSRKAVLYLRPTNSGKNTCDSIQCAWQRLERANRLVNGQSFHERLLHKWAFLAELHESEAEVVVRCHDPAHFQARTYSKAGRVPVEERNIRSGSILELSLPTSMQGINSGDNTTLLRGKNLGVVCTNARRWLVTTYKNKGTPVLWRAKVDTSYTAYDEFVLEVSHLSYEICDDGYFEYHRIYVKGVQKGDDVELSWEFQGNTAQASFSRPAKTITKTWNSITKPTWKNTKADFLKNYWNIFADDYRNKHKSQLIDHGKDYGI